MQEVLKYLRKADNDFNLIEENDTVLVGVSGGKDSVMLLYALSIYQKFKEKQFDLIGVHMNMGFPNSDIEPIKTFMDAHQIPFHVVDVPIYDILTHYLKEDGSLDCSRCSNLKRGAIVNIAKEFSANKIAFAHHGDDAVETFFMNAIHSAKLDTFQPLIHYEDNEVCFIRPFIYLHESEIIQTIKKEELPVVVSQCPKDGFSSRSEIKALLQEIYEQFPTSKKNLLGMLSHEKGIWKKEK